MATAEQVRLDDGRSVAIRPILPADLDPLRRFFESLTPATRRLRFHLPTKEVTQSLLHAFTAVDHRSHVALVADAGAGAQRPASLIAEARYVRCADSDAAEVAFVVAEGWRRVGLGTSLARRLIRSARQAGVRHLFGDALVDNGEALGFLRSLGARVTTAHDGRTVRLGLDL